MAEASEMLDELALNSGKKVTFRAGRISDEEHASESIQGSEKMSKYQFGIKLQAELIRMRIRTVNGKKLNAKQVQDLDDVLSRADYGQVLAYLDAEGGNLQAPAVSQVKVSGGA